MTCSNGSTRALGLSLALAALALATPARGQAPADAHWLPWLGCWEIVVPTGQTAPPGRAQVCVHAAPGAPGATFVNMLGGKVVSQEEVVADGARHSVAQGGCTGWQTASWSADGRRLFHHSELDCGAGNKRSSSGVMAFLPDDQWLQVDAAGVPGSHDVGQARYRQMAPAAAAATGFMPQGIDLAIQTARTAASAPLSLRDVVEASRQLEPEVLQALVFERGNGYEVNARVARQLADARVPADVIDLMVALSYPDFFDIKNGSPRLALADGGSSGGSSRGRYPGGWGGGYGCYDRFGYPGYGYSGYGYPGWIYSYPLSYYGGYDPCWGGGYGGPWGGYGWGGGWYGPYGGGVIVTRGGGGRVVKGEGYTPSTGSTDTGRKAHGKGSSGKGPSTSVGKTDGGSKASPSGRSSGSSGGSSSSGGERKAHPKGK